MTFFAWKPKSLTLCCGLCQSLRPIGHDVFCLNARKGHSLGQGLGRTQAGFEQGFGKDSGKGFGQFWLRVCSKTRHSCRRLIWLFIGAWFFTDIVQIYEFVDISLHAEALMQSLWKPKSPQVMARTRHTLNRNNLFTIMFNAKVETIENGLMESLLHKMNLTIMWKG